MKTLASGIGYIDLQFLGQPDVIATAVIHGPGGVALVDPGPATCLDTLEQALASHGMGVLDVRQIILTHIHLDHAGATGSLVRKNPAIAVYVHARGARHLIDPSRLLDSATRLYGDDMQRLWGDVLPVPADRVTSLEGGERVPASNRELDVAYTPGHASHHVSYFDRASGVAYVGDTAGVRTAQADYVLPPTPPPDIDLEVWRESLARIEAWGSSTLFLTHCGPAAEPASHLRRLDEQLTIVGEMVRRSLTLEDTDEDRFASFAEEFGRHLRRQLPAATAARYERAAPLSYNWQGLARYWRKKTG